MRVYKENINIGQTPMGNELSILKYTIDSGNPGKTIYIQSGTHGGEVTQWILHELFSYLQNNLKRGKLILVPNANPVSWLQRNYFSTNGKFDMYMGKDWNRNFPGDEQGSLGERIASVLFEQARHADFVLDLHTSRLSLPFAIYFNKEMKKYTKVFGLEYNQFIDTTIKTSYQNTINASLFAVGVPSLCIECGSHDAYEPENIELVRNGILRILKFFGLIDNAPIAAAAEQQIFYDKTITYTASKGGLIRLAKKLGEYVQKGDVLYYYYDNNDLGNIQNIIAKHNGVVFKISPTHIYWTGDEVVQLIEQ